MRSIRSASVIGGRLNCPCFFMALIFMETLARVRPISREICSAVAFPARSRIVFSSARLHRGLLPIFHTLMGITT